MYSLLSPYLGQLACGIDINNMEVTPVHISIEDLPETNKKVYVGFKLTENEVTLTEPQISTPTRSVFDVLMSHETQVPSLKLGPKKGNA